MYAFVGLGNPGPEYAATRHNVGWLCLDAIADRWNIRLNDKRKLAVLGEGKIEGREVVLVKPRTFVNASGEAVVYVRDRFALPPSHIIVVYDDMDLPLGRLRVRPKGGPGTHNGMKSIIATMGSEEFPRIRVGIGRPAPLEDSVRFVLGAFPKEDVPVLKEAVDRVAETARLLVSEGLERAMVFANA